MKSVQEMSLVEFQEHLSKIINFYTLHKVDITNPKTFIYGGVIFNKDTSKKDWELLDKWLGRK